MAKHCARVKLVLCAFSLCTVLLMSISGLTEREHLKKSYTRTFEMCGLTIFSNFALTFDDESEESVSEDGEDTQSLSPRSVTST